MKGVIGYVAAFVAGALLCGVLVLVLTHGAGKRLDADLSAARTALAAATSANGQLADANRNLKGELDGADRIVTSQQQQLAQDSKRLASLQSDLANAKQLIENLIGAVGNGLGDLDASATEIASLARQLYSGYHLGAAERKNSGNPS